MTTELRSVCRAVPRFALRGADLRVAPAACLRLGLYVIIIMYVVATQTKTKALSGSKPKAAGSREFNGFIVRKEF